MAATRELAAAPDAALDDVAACSARAGDVVRIHREVRHRLETEWFDEHGPAGHRRRRCCARRAPGPRARSSSTSSRRSPPAGAELLRSLGEVADVHALVGITGDAARRRAGARRPPPGRHRRARRTRSSSPAAPPASSAPATRTTRSGPPSASWPAGCARASPSVGRRSSTAPPTPTARLLHEHLAAAGIPVNGSPVTAVGEQLLGRTLRALLALPERSYRRRDVLGVLTGAPVLDGDGRAPSRAWERVSRAAGVAGGDDWDLRLATFAAQQRERAEQADRDEDEAQARHLRLDADRADELATFVRRLRTAVDRGSSIATWAGLVGWSRELLAHLPRRPSARAWRGPSTSSRPPSGWRRRSTGWSASTPSPALPPTRRGVPADARPASSSRRSAGSAGSARASSSATSPRRRDSCSTGSPCSGWPRAPSRPGASRTRSCPTTSGAAAGGELPLRADRLHDDRRHLLAAVAAAGEAVLCASRGDLRRAGERPASRWLLADAARLAGVDGLRSADLARLARRTGSTTCRRSPAGWPPSTSPPREQELRLAAVARDAADRSRPATTPILDAAARGGAGPSEHALHPLRRQPQRRGRRRDAARARGSRPPGSRTGPPAPTPTCSSYVLRVEPVEEPERRIEIDALSTGAPSSTRSSTAFVDGRHRLGHPLDRWGPDDERRLLDIADELLPRATRRGPAPAAGCSGGATRQQIARRPPDASSTTDSDRLAPGHRPVATEHRFTDLPVRCQRPRPASAGRSTGSTADRTARWWCSTTRPAAAGRYGDLSADEPAPGGTRLQPYLYARAAARRLPHRAPGVGRLLVRLDQGQVRARSATPSPPTWPPRSRTPSTSSSTGIGAGLFPAQPSAAAARAATSTAGYCRPDGLSGADRRRAVGAQAPRPRPGRLLRRWPSRRSSMTTADDAARRARGARTSTGRCSSRPAPARARRAASSTASSPWSRTACPPTASPPSPSPRRRPPS